MSEETINFYTENDFEVSNEGKFKEWLHQVISSEGKKTGEINFIFCDDEYLHKMNVEYLDHDTYTDIISFDMTIGNILGGDIFISTERVRDNAGIYEVSFDQELKRVMVHGVLHFCGYQDKTEKEKEVMRAKEEEKMKMFHVEQ